MTSRKRRRTEIYTHVNRLDREDPDYSPCDEIDFSHGTNLTNLSISLPKKSQKELRKVQDELDKSEPSVLTVLTTPLLLKDKTRLIQLCSIYSDMEDENSLEKLELRDTIQIELEKSILNYTKYNRYTQKEHESFSSEIAQLEQYDGKEELKYAILNLQTTLSNKRVIFSEFKRLDSLHRDDEEYTKLKNWLDWAVSLPYDRVTEVDFTPTKLREFLFQVKTRMDSELFGMKKAKEEILLFLNSRLTNPNMTRCSLGLIGQPGVGKTTLVKILANILHYPLEQISLGGMCSAEFLRGHQSVYIGSTPGEIVKCIRRMGSKNGILFFDEVDKVSGNKDVCATLLHITDSSQNREFQDNFLGGGIKIDLSHLWLIYSMNSLPDDSALADRIYTVTVDGYTRQEKCTIIRDYLLKKLLMNIGLNKDTVSISSDGIEYILDITEENSGIRGIERTITEILNKVNFVRLHGTRGFDFTFGLDKKQKKRRKKSNDKSDELILPVYLTKTDLIGLLG